MITFTPKKNTNQHATKNINIGDNQFIAIPKINKLLMMLLLNITFVNDNQYIDHGAVFNGETTSELTGWDNADSPYLYYGEQRYQDD